MENLHKNLKTLKQIEPDAVFAARSRAFILASAQLPKIEVKPIGVLPLVSRLAFSFASLALVTVVGASIFLNPKTTDSVVSLNQESLNKELADLQIDIHISPTEYKQREFHDPMASLEDSEKQINNLLEKSSL